MTTHESSLLQAKSLSKSFYSPTRVEILKNVNLTIYGGESVAIIGRSGEGKSTLLQILGTLEEPCNGQLTIDGQLINQKNRAFIRNTAIGFVFQSFHLLEDYTALENVLMPARIGRHSAVNGQALKKRGMELLDLVGLADRAHFHTKLLSGGEKQRVALARAMCNDPKLILADEPSGNLDYHTAELIHQILLDFAKNSNKALVMVTHNQELANLCSRRLHLTNYTLTE